MSQSVQSTVSMSKEISEESSYSKTVSSSKMMSSRMESTETIEGASSLKALTSGVDPVDSLVKHMMEDQTSLVSKLSDDLGGLMTGALSSTTEKSTSISQSEDSFSYKKSEVSTSSSVQESSKSMSIKSASEEVSMTKTIESSVEKEPSSPEVSSPSTVCVEKFPAIYVVIMDYTPREGDKEGLPVMEGQEVEVVDSSKAHKWRVRLRQTSAGKMMTTEGTVPSCYLEKKEYQTPPSSPQLDAKMQAAYTRREKVLKELVESEEDFSRDMQFVVNSYMKEMEEKHMPKDLRDYKDSIFSNFKAISEFHNNVLMKGIQYYRNEPARLGKTFLRLERDFDMHVAYCRDEPEAQQQLVSGPLKDYFDEYSRKIRDEKTLCEHLKLPIQRINDYQLLLKELIKYTVRLKEDTIDLEKAHDFMQAIPQRITDLQYLNSIQGYRGNLHKLGRILKHDWFEVTDGNNIRKERYAFLFKGRIFITDTKRVGLDRTIFLVKHVIKLPEVEIVDNADDDELKLRFQHLQKKQPGFPFSFRARTIEQKEDWLKVIQVTAIPQGLEDLEDDEPEPVIEEIENKKFIIEEEKMETKVEILEDFDAYEEMHTVVTESVRSGSITSLDDFHSALEDEPSLCFTFSEAESGGPGRPRFVKPFRAASCAEGSVATLECEVAASPSPTVAWLKDNQPLKPSKKTSIESNGIKQRLVLKGAEGSDAGLYTIIASNIHGTVSCSAPFTVHSGLETLPPSTPGGSLMPYGPVFVEKLRDMELQEGTAFRVCVVVQGEPVPAVRFYKEDQEIFKEGHVHFLQENKDCYELVIENVLPEDAGKYSCVAVSSAGQNVTSCHITVSREKVFIKPPDDDTEAIATPELMEPDPLWIKDSKEFESSERFKVSIDEAEDTVALVFQHVTPDNAGMYTCVASSSGGKISCSAELTVQGGIPREPEAPKATSSATKVEAKEGSSALLELSATGFPKPTVLWSKDGEELKSSDKYKILLEDEETYTMAIKNVEKGDSGEYCALAINELGESTVAYHLTVTGPPKFIKPMKDTSVMVDEDIKLEVEVDGSPEPTVTWCRGGQQLSESDRVKFEAEGNVCRLVIKKASSEDAGTYSCNIKNKNGCQSGFGALQVNAQPKFIQGLCDTTTSLQQDAIFKIKISGNPKPDIKWSKDGSDLKVDGTRIIQKEESVESYSLIIKKTIEKDSGQYICEASNKHGKDVTKGKLVVKGKPSFFKELQDRTVKESEKNIDLIVKVSGTPPPNIKWYIGDIEITESSNYKILSDEKQQSFTLRIKEVKQEMTGQYKCEAINDAGTTSTSAKLTVIEEIKTVKPSFSQELKDRTVKEGEKDVNLSVKISGTPSPKVKWYIGDMEIIESTNYRIISDENAGSYTLRIKEVKKEVAGQYKCEAVNDAGITSTSAKLTIIEEIKTTSPKFLQGLKDCVVKEGEDICFDLKIEGMPTPSSKWNKDGAELTIDGKRIKVKSEAEDSLTLIIGQATKDDAGKYTCVITNSYGSESSSSKLTVTEIEVKPSFEKGMKDQTIREEETAKFNVKFSGKPKPTAKWNKDDVELTIDGKRVQVISEVEDSLTLVIEKATKDDTGKYSCIISNISGSVNSTSKLTVADSEKPPSFTQGLKDVSVKEEETVKFVVKFQGKPKPSAKWSKDGAELTIDNKRIQVNSEAEDSLTIVLNQVTKKDSGKYVCIITNTSGSESSSSVLTVTESEKAPSFREGLKDVIVKEEEAIKLCVKYDGKPKPSVKWMKDESEISVDGERIQIKTDTEGSQTLLIKKAGREDSAKYSCIISNSCGSETTSGKLTVSDSQTSPTFSQGLKDKDVKEGETARFTVKFSGKPKPTAKWNFDGDELTIDGKHTQTIVEEEDSLTLVINQVTKDDAGKYMCTINNSCGSATTSSRLSVSAAPVFVKSLNDTEGEEGAMVRLTVKFEGQPEPIATWKKDGSPLDIDGKRLKMACEADDSQTLVIDKVIREDIGVYSCEIKNACGSTSTSGKLAVTGKPVIKRKLEDKESLESELNVTLTVEVKGTPMPDVKWSFNDSEVADGDKYQIAYDATKGVCKLIIKKVTSELQGRYKFVASNPSGKAETSANLSVLIKPSFQKNLNDIEVIEGEVIKLETLVKGHPKPEITWFKDNKPISSKDCYQISSEDNSHYLTIKDSRIEDGVSYTCKARNKAGEAIQKASVSVKSKRLTQAPKFLTHLTDQVIVIDDAARFEVKVTGKPAPQITWYRNEDELKESEVVILQNIPEDETYMVTLKNVKIHDSARYTCKAVNENGDAAESALLTVKEPVAPKIEGLEDLEVNFGAPARLKAKISGFPKPEIKWFKNNSILKASPDCYQMVHDAESGKCALVIQNVQSDEAGSYSCTASNSAGQEEAYCKLSIKAQSPVVTKEMKDLSADVGDDLKFQVEVHGYPTPTIIWLKNGIALPEDSRFIKTGSGNLYTLEIKDVLPRDEGTYTCKAKNDAGEATSKGNLKIQDFGPVVEQKFPQSIKLIEGDQLHLKTKCSGQPFPEIKWLKDGKPLKTSNKIKTVTNPDGTIELIIDGVTHADSGPYKLLAVNEKGKAVTETDVSVDFQEKTTKPFVKQMQPLDIIVGNPITLEAKVVGNPKPSLKWFKNGDLIDVADSLHVKLSVTDEGNAVLFIDHSTLEDSGEYKLCATNELGEDSSSAIVSVSQPGKKPSILKELKTVRINEGQEGVLVARVAGFPTPTVSWMQNGRNVMEDAHCMMTYEPDGHVSLIIKKASKDDGGNYAIVAANKLGKAISEAPVIVVPVVKSEIKAPKKIFEFLQGIMPALVPEGRPLKLHAQVTTDPKPMSVKWLKDGKELASNERVQVTQDNDGNLRLSIKHMTQDDRGKYCVIASDGKTDIRSEAVVTMVPAMPGMSGNKPQFLKGLEPVKLSEGEKLTLQAHLPPDMKVSIKWMKDGEEIERGGRVQMIEQPDGTIALVIENALSSDSGKYVVIVNNEEGKTRSSAMVAVIGDGFKLPEIIEVLKPAAFLEGHAAKLEAKIDGEPKPGVRWLRDGAEIQPSNRIELIQSPDGTVALLIKETHPDDAGKYSLIVDNIGGETRCSAPITVNRPPLFSSLLKSVTGVDGHPAKLSAKISGDPLPDVKWLKDGVEIPKLDGPIRQVYQPDGTSALVFDKCSPADAGNYQCVAKNPHGKKSSAADLKVIGKEIEGQSKSAPDFVTPLRDVTISDSESFKLEAEVSGNPLPDAQWFLDDQHVGFSNNVISAFDGKKVSLYVSKSNPLHSGTFECRLSNILGDAKSQCKVSVLGNKAPKFIERLSDMEFTIAEPMTLKCRVEGIPDPEIKWFFNGAKIEPGLKYTISKEDNKCLLMLSRPRSKDSGVYECRAKNPAGEDSCRCNITISDAGGEGEPAMFLKKLRDSDALPGMTAKFTACVSGFPKPNIEWFKDGRQLIADSKHTMEVDPNGVIRLLLRAVSKSDLGTYRVSISNMFGSDTCTANLNLEGKESDKTITPVSRNVDTFDRTGPPSPLAHAPYILKMSDTGLSMAWRPSIPQYPQVPFTYSLEMCRLPDGDWSIYRSGIKDSSCDIRDLIPGTDYRFRIRVENKYGLSEPSPYIAAHRSKLQSSLPGDHKPRDYDLEHPPLEKYAAAPRFLRQEEENVYAVRGQSARVEFWVYGCPQPKITWYFNNIEVDIAKYDFLEDRNGQVIMFITRMGDSDVGYYTCKAVNEHGEAQQKIKLMIADAPIFSKKLDQLTIMLRGGGEMVCQVTGVPDPKIKWFKDWHPLSESSRIKISQIAPDTCVLSLSNSILKDCGLYTCTATNVAGTASTSAMLNIEECESEYHILTYRRPKFVKPCERPLEEHYDIGDELGRGTQGITYHVVERSSGKSYGAKVMHGEGKLMDFMTAEMDIMNQLYHPRLLRLWNAYQTQSQLTLITDICGGGELLPNLLQHSTLTESLIAHYIKQALEGLHHMHEKNIAHLGLTIGDLLITRLNSDSIKISDFGLATRLYSGQEYIQEYGHPEFVAPEVANKQPVTLAADIWSIGIISYLLLTGDSPFLSENDRETLKLVQKGKVDFFHDGFVVLSDEARDFVSRLLSIDPSKRPTVTEALKHKWLEIASLPDKCDELTNMDHLKEYYKKWKSWYANASCRRFYRRRTLESCFTHPSRMIYPPDEEYTPVGTPDRELGRSRVKPAAFDDVTFQQRIEREPIDVRSESHYQNGPDTFLLPLRDPDFPVRIRRYLKVGANRSPILARHLKDKHWGYCDVAVKERRKFMDVMDEEINDEKKGLSRSAPLRLRHEVGTVGSGFDHIECRMQKKKRGFRMASGRAPYFREKIKDVVIREEQEAEFTCCVTANPDAQFSWFRNDGILIESSRILFRKTSDGHCSLILNPAKAYDVGVYKCVARNIHGTTVCRARLNIGSVPGKPEPPKTDKCSDSEIYLSWMPPMFEGHSPTLGYSLEYKESGDENWTKIASNISHEFFLVHNLKPAATYFFRIAAINKFGWGDFSLPSEPTLTLTESSTKIELSRAEKFQQDQTESGQSLILEEPDCQRLNYGIEEDPVVMEEGNPTDFYNFISEVARGRFSVVLKVWVKKINTALVAKACHLTEATTQNVEREFDIYKSLQHERIPVLYSASRNLTSVFLVMEKLSGIDVLTYLSSRPLYTEETVSRIVHQVIDAVEYLHFRSMCYFELRPDNVVMVDRYNCQVKLIDFGSAQYIPEEGGKIQVKGSPEYLAPEVLKGEEVNSSVDIWGVGVLTYILLSGTSPFSGETDSETRDNVLYVRYHFDHLYKEVSQEATLFLMQVFKRTPQKRPTAEECLENKWLLPNEFMIKKREHTIFLSHHLRDFSEQYHSLKAKSTPSNLLNIFGQSSSTPLNI